MFRFLLIAAFLSLLRAQTVPNVTHPANDSTTTISTSTTINTTTTIVPTTTPAPLPTVPIYTVVNGSNICLMVQMNLKVNVNYFNKSGEELLKSIYINSTTIKPTVSGICSTKLQTLELQSSSRERPVWNLAFSFIELDSGYFSLDVIKFEYTMDNTSFPGTNDTTQHTVSRNESQFKCLVGRYYQCMAKQTFKLGRSPSAPLIDIQPDVFLVISDLKANAFRQSNSSMFVGTMTECSEDYVPNKVVPIVVGVALAVMIVIALITFIIGSRRRQAGYQEI